MSRLDQLLTAIEKNNWILLTVGAVIMSVIAGVGIKNNFDQRREEKAKQLLFPIEIALRAEEYDVALEGGGGEIGALEFIKKHKKTTVVNVAHVYAAIAFFNRKKGNEQEKKQDEAEAIAHLKKFDLKRSYLQPMIWCWIGDIYSDQKMYDKALVCYKKAVDHESNEFMTPRYLRKIAIVYEAQGKYKKAMAFYKRIYTNYPSCDEASEAKKHEGRVQATLGGE